MTRLIDSSLEKLSTIMSDMGEMAIQCISLATDSYLQGSSNSDKVHDLSDQIRQKYFQVEDLIFDMMLKYQPVAEDFRMIRSCTEISYAYSDLVVLCIRYYESVASEIHFGNLSDCPNTSIVKSFSSEESKTCHYPNCPCRILQLAHMQGSVNSFFVSKFH